MRHTLRVRRQKPVCLAFCDVFVSRTGFRGCVANPDNGWCIAERMSAYKRGMARFGSSSGMQWDDMAETWGVMLVYDIFG